MGCEERAERCEPRRGEPPISEVLPIDSTLTRKTTKTTTPHTHTYYLNLTIQLTATFWREKKNSTFCHSKLGFSGTFSGIPI